MKIKGWMLIIITVCIIVLFGFALAGHYAEASEPVCEMTIEVMSCTPDWFRSQTEVREYVKTTSVYHHPYIPDEYDCDDYMINLWKESLRDGRPIGMLLVMQYDENGDIKRYHASNFVIVGNRLYQVEGKFAVVKPIDGWESRLD